MSPGHEPAAQPEIIASDVGAQEEGLERGCIAGEEGAWESDSATLCGQGFPCAGDVMHTHTSMPGTHSCTLHCQDMPRAAPAGGRWPADGICMEALQSLSAPSRHTPYLLVVVCAVAAHSLSVSCRRLRRRGTRFVVVVVCAVAAHSLFVCRSLRRRGTLLI